MGSPLAGRFSIACTRLPSEARIRLEQLRRCGPTQPRLGEGERPHVGALPGLEPAPVACEGSRQELRMACAVRQIRSRQRVLALQEAQCVEGPLVRCTFESRFDAGFRDERLKTAHGRSAHDGALVPRGERQVHRQIPVHRQPPRGRLADDKEIRLAKDGNVVAGPGGPLARIGVLQQPHDPFQRLIANEVHQRWVR